MTDDLDDRKWLDDRTVLASVQKRADGTPRFVIPLPGNFADDPGLRMLARHETEQEASVLQSVKESAIESC